jgi:hypothetical protein
MSGYTNDYDEKAVDQFTESDLAGLSPEERAAVTGTDDADREGRQEEVQDDAVHGEAPSPLAVQHQPFIPSFDVDPAQLNKIHARLEALAQHLQDGDIDLIEYTRQRDPLIVEQTQIALTQEFNQQSASQLWKHEQGIFFKESPAYREDPVMNGALRAVFKTLDTEENAHRSGYELLNEAKAIVEERFGKSSRSSSGRGRDTDARDSAAHHDLATASRSVGAPGGGGDEFADLDRLTGNEYERALARLTDDQTERYLRSS